MNMDKQEETESEVLVEETLVQFKDAMKSQEKQNLQIGRRTSYMITYGVFTIILLSIGVVFLTWTQKNDTDRMNEYMESMTNNISVMSNAILKMQASMNMIEGGIHRVSSHTQAISHSINQKENLVDTLLDISDSVKLMQSDAHVLGKSMGDVNYNLSTINKQMKNLNRKLGVIVQDTNRMPSPTRMFPF